MELADYCNALYGQYNNNIKKISDESTEMIFRLTKNPNLEVRPSINGNMTKGKFYLICYNYNGNKLWCPIFVIDDRYNTEVQKRIIYAINFNYLPHRYKIVFFDKLFSMFKDIIEKNKKNNQNGGNVNDEFAMKVNFESIYRALKSNGDFNYCITGFDYSKIVGMEKGSPMIYSISTMIVSRFLFMDTRYVNRNVMMQAMKDTEVEKEKEKFAELLKYYDQIVENFSEDSIEFYKQLRNLESKYKLYENV